MPARPLSLSEWTPDRAYALTGPEGFAIASTLDATDRIYPDLSGLVVVGEPKAG